MKRQYLGDSRDSFKWDYHHFLVPALGLGELQVVWMMTPDDGGGDGKTAPELFPARPEVLAFCNSLRHSRDPSALAGLPATTGESYKVRLVGSSEHFVHRDRGAYFAGIEPAPGVIFLDPDNGLEPEKSCSEKHVSYGEIDGLVGRMPQGSVISVFQHFRRKPFPDDFARIRERLKSGYTTAIYWHSLMFVAIAKTETAMARVVAANMTYSNGRPVSVLE